MSLYLKVDLTISPATALTHYFISRLELLNFYGKWEKSSNNHIFQRFRVGGKLYLGKVLAP